MTRRNIALLICICFLLVTVISAAFVLSHSNHDCSGERCEICCRIDRVSETIGQLRVTALFAAMAAAAALIRLPPLAQRLIYFATPVSQGVQLNN